MSSTVGTSTCECHQSRPAQPAHVLIVPKTVSCAPTRMSFREKRQSKMTSESVISRPMETKSRKRSPKVYPSRATSCGHGPTTLNVGTAPLRAGSSSYCAVLTPLGQEGFTARFGVVWIDYKDGCKRYPKDSATYMKKYFAERMVKA